MSVATATRAELVTLFNEICKAEVQLRQLDYGSGEPAAPGRFTADQIDAQLALVQTALTAVTGA